MMTGRAHSGQGDPVSMSPHRADGGPDQEAGAMPLVSLVDVGGGQEIELADYMVPARGPGIAPAALDGLLSDALFGEVIDISDLIPSVLSPPADTATPATVDAAARTEFGFADGGEISAAAGHGAGLIILYDDDILASDGTIL